MTSANSREGKPPLGRNIFLLVAFLVMTTIAIVTVLVPELEDDAAHDAKGEADSESL